MMVLLIAIWWYSVEIMVVRDVYMMVYNFIIIIRAKIIVEWEKGRMEKNIILTKQKCNKKLLTILFYFYWEWAKNRCFHQSFLKVRYQTYIILCVRFICKYNLFLLYSINIIIIIINNSDIKIIIKLNWQLIIVR